MLVLDDIVALFWFSKSIYYSKNKRLSHNIEAYISSINWKKNSNIHWRIISNIFWLEIQAGHRGVKTSRECHEYTSGQI